MVGLMIFVNICLVVLFRVDIGIKKDVDQTKLDINSLKIKDEEQQKMIEELKDKNKFLGQTIIGGLITAGIGIVVCFIKIGLGI